jgi:EmrB/QacA subfamily drug resistance transporter
MQPGQARLTRPGRLVQRQPFLGMLVVALGTLGVPFDSAVNVAFPLITSAFGLPIPAIQWVVVAYTLTYAALMLVFGRIGDMLGYRRMFLIGCGWSTLAFIGCATAPSFPWLLGARVLQGIGAALALSCGPALATSLYPESDRTRILGLYTMIFGLGGAFGPILAGQLVQYWDWPAVFWFRVPITFTAFVLAWGLPRGERLGQAQFDGYGAVLLVLTVTALLLSFNQLQHLDTTLWGVVLLSLLTAGSGIGFVMRERRAIQPIIDLRYFHDRDFALVNAAHIALNVTGFSIMLLVPFYLNQLVGLSLSLSGVVLAAGPAGIIAAAPVAGRLAKRIAPRRLALGGLLLEAAMQIVIGSSAEHPLMPALTAAMFLHGFGLGLFQVAYFDIATATIPRRDRGVAGSLVMMTRTIGVVTGATVLMLLFQSLRANAIALGAPESAAFLYGFRGAFWIAATLPVLSAAAGLLCGWGRVAPRAT